MEQLPKFAQLRIKTHYVKANHHCWKINYSIITISLLLLGQATQPARLPTQAGK